MAVSIAPDPANYKGVWDPISSTESTFAHECAAHLLSALHGDDKKSVFYGGGDVLTEGHSVFQSDMKRLMFGYDDSWYIQPPPGRGEKYIPQAATYSQLSRGTIQQFANSRKNSSPSAVYRWVAGVKR